MQERNRMFTKITADNPLHQTLSPIYSHITHCIKSCIDNTGIAQMVSQVWLRTERCQWIYSSNLHVFIQNILMFEDSIWIALCAAIHIFHPKKVVNHYQS